MPAFGFVFCRGRQSSRSLATARQTFAVLFASPATLPLGKAALDTAQNVLITGVAGREKGTQRDGNLIHPVGGPQAVDAAHGGGEPHRGRDGRLHGRVVQGNRWDALQVGDRRRGEASYPFAANEQA